MMHMNSIIIYSYSLKACLAQEINFKISKTICRLGLRPRPRRENLLIWFLSSYFTHFLSSYLLQSLSACMLCIDCTLSFSSVYLSFVLHFYEMKYIITM